MQFSCIHVYLSRCLIHALKVCIDTQPHHHGQPEDELKMCREWSKARHRDHPAFCLWGAGAFVCVPRLPLLPMLGSLASAIQLYSGGMETGLRSPGTTNQQSEYWLRGGVAGRWWLRDSVGDNQESGRVRGVCRRGGAVPSKAFSVSIYQSLICEYCCCYVTVVYCC